MSAQELLVQQFVAAILRLAARGPTDGTALPVPSFGDVEAAVREHYKAKEIDWTALGEAVRKAALTRLPDDLGLRPDPGREALEALALAG